MKTSQIQIRSLLLIAIAWVIGTGLTSASAAGVPTEQIRTTVDKALIVLKDPKLRATSKTKERRDQLRQILFARFDFNEMARLTLARHWKDRSVQEQEEFVRLFTDLLERSYLTTIENYAGERVTFLTESVSGPYAQVRSRITTDRRMEISIDYRLIESGARWAVYDVVLDGVSLVSNYRSQFNSIIRTSSFADLLTKLRTRQIEAHAIPRTGHGSRDGTN